MAAPYSLENTLRLHDEAIANWFAGLLVDYGTVSGTARNEVPILRTFATPDRAWAALENVLVAQGWIAGATDEERRENVKREFDTLPLPFLTIERVDPIPHPEGGGVPKRFRRQLWNGTTQQWEVHPWPGSYRTEYRATLWSAKKYTAAWLQEWVMSQLGLIGAAEAEVFIDVEHAEPWGTLKQALRMDGSNDLSELEGVQPRYQRHEISFTLNTLHFRQPTALVDFQDGVSTGAAFYGEVLPRIEAIEDLTGVDLAPATMSGNLYEPYYPPALISTRWPKAGGATVSNSTVTPDEVPDRGALKVGVTVAADQVDITNRPLGLDGDNHAIVSYAFQYLTDVPVDLDLQQHSGANMAAPTWTRVDLQRLPISEDWSRVHGFSLVTDNIFDLALIGTGTLATLRIAKIQVKHVRSGTKVSPTSTTPVGFNNKHVWTGLQPGAYLIAVGFTSTPATGTITIEDDQLTPTYTNTDVIDTTKQRSSVFLVQPASASIALLVPLALSIAAVYLQRYDGGYAGSDL